VSTRSSDKGNDAFRDVVRGAMRAISREAELEVNYTADKPGLTGLSARLPLPSRALDARQAAQIRGHADSFALRLAHHDTKTHAKYQPTSGLARDVFNALEQARCEAIGARAMNGVAQNLDSIMVDRAKTEGLENLATAEDVPLAAALGFLARERLTGAKIPSNAREAVDMVRLWVDEKAGGDLDALAKALDNQDAYAQLTKDVIRDLDIQDETGEEPEQSDEEAEDGEGEDESGDDQGQENDSEGEGESESESQSSEDGEGEGSETLAQEDDGDTDAMGDEVQEGETPYRPNTPLSDMPPQFDYRAYTTAFDEVIAAEELCDAEELTRLRAYLDQQLLPLQSAVTKLANRLQRRLLAQQNRAWEFDLEEGMLDAGRLTRVVTAPTHPLSYKIETDTDFKDTVVTLLIDNSGSMRGRPISIAAICADILARTLERCSVKVEILGFTTRAWKGGQSREAWIEAGKPANPGRLNDLRHIVYKAADAPWRRGRRNLGLMMREGLLKENIDGEALLWAHNRLIARPEERRILMVISDGAPVDDSTLSVNTGSYLERHLRQLIQWIETRSPVELIAIGIGHDVTRYYSRAVTLLDAEQLGGAMTEQLASLFDEAPPAPRGWKNRHRV
jgi:cobaltochelatase CobT